MADKKLTDEEIIKALEDYIKDNEFEYFHSNMMGEYPLIRKSLDTIIRKTEEIESLKAELSNARRKALLEASSKFAGHSNYHGRLGKYGSSTVRRKRFSAFLLGLL